MRGFSPREGEVRIDISKGERVLKPLAFCSLLLSLASFLSGAAASDPIVSVSGGKIRGKIAEPGGASFKGVPFAAPPLGDLRWREPAPVVPWRAYTMRTHSELPAFRRFQAGTNRKPPEIRKTVST